jgi:hypothetical protein
MLNARWKTGTPSSRPKVSAPRVEAPRAGQIRSFRITELDRDRKTIGLELN